MTIDRIGAPDPIQPGKKSGWSDRVRENSEADSISLSSEAVEKSERYKAIELVSAAPDVRIDRVEELRQKINDPAYLDERILKATADSIMESFGL
jgi:negative regulator of flagellin synthesis FlgM